jgi:hypothetical protein
MEDKFSKIPRFITQHSKRMLTVRLVLIIAKLVMIAKLVKITAQLVRLQFSRERISSLLTESLESSQDSENERDDTLAAGMEDAYAGFEDARKWHLKSGRAVEDILFENYLSLSQDKSTVSLLLRGWIIDLDGSGPDRVMVGERPAQNH